MLVLHSLRITKHETDKATRSRMRRLGFGKKAPRTVVKAIEMIEYQKEAILVSFLNEKQRYKRLAEYLVDLIRDDPSSPKESLHTIVYRIKDEFRLIEKIDAKNKEHEHGEPPISERNYQAKVGDLLGVRIICLRLSDVERVEAYLGLLSEEKILRFLKEPVRNRSFIPPVDPNESISARIDRRYSGYSSIHYQVELGENSDAPAGLRDLQAEVQLRTILEEAWGEIDHKYRYLRSRSGVTLPDYIQRGFYNLSVYLQVAALQAEDLCLLAETYSLNMGHKFNGKTVTALADGPGSIDIEETASCQKQLPPTLDRFLEETLGFKVTVRTLNYIERRLNEVGFTGRPQEILRKIFTENRLFEFKAIFRETLNATPFTNEKERNIDVINALNFVIFDEREGKRVAEEGLRSVLRWRRDRSKC